MANRKLARLAALVAAQVARQVSCGCCTRGCVCQIHSRIGLIATCAYHHRVGHTRETETQESADARARREARLFRCGRCGLVGVYALCTHCGVNGTPLSAETVAAYIERGHEVFNKE